MPQNTPACPDSVFPKHPNARNVSARTMPEPPPVDNARWIALTKGLFALIDAEDFPRVSSWYWSALVRTGRTAYAMRVERRRTIYLHRFIMGALPGTDVDHINGNGQDCRKINLRVCTHAENQRNYSKTSSPTASSFKGVRWDRDRSRWVAWVKLDRKSRFLGRFASEEEAARAYDAAARELFGEFAKPNFPEETSSTGQKSLREESEKDGIVRV